MFSASENEFERGNAGASTTELKMAGNLKINSLVMLRDGTHPCKITQFATAKTGKHGAAKAMVTGRDIFTGKTYEETFVAGDMVPCPVVTKHEVQCLGVDTTDRTMQLLQESGELKEDLRLPEEGNISRRVWDIVDAACKECLVTYQVWGDKEQIIAVREGAEM